MGNVGRLGASRGPGASSGALRSRTDGGRTRAGFSIVEVAIGIVLLTIAMSGLLGGMVSFALLARVSRENALALQAARAMAEKAQDTSFAQVFATFNANPNDDPGGPGAAPGKDFSVRGLCAQPGDPDGRVGEFVFPTVSGALREDVVDAGLSMPRDLDADGAVDASDHALNYVLLPMRIRVQWRGAAGDRTLAINPLLTNR